MKHLLVKPNSFPHKYKYILSYEKEILMFNMREKIISHLYNLGCEGVLEN